MYQAVQLGKSIVLYTTTNEDEKISVLVDKLSLDTSSTLFLDNNCNLYRLRESEIEACYKAMSKGKLFVDCNRRI